MTAKEMFEKLGYELDESYTHLTYVDKKNEDEDYICFYEYTEKIGIGKYTISSEELKAINQQCKELGWLYE